MSLAAFSASAADFRAIAVNVFGDGDPANGVEDDRQQLAGGRGQGASLADQRLNAGTIKCDGKIRGTAMVIDTRELAPALKGVVLASAAHVLFDLDRKQRFQRCEFQFLALGALRSYRAKIDLHRLKMGKYDPRKATDSVEFGEGDWIFLYVPRPWKAYNPAESIVPSAFSFANVTSFRQAGGEFRLIAFDVAARVISVSRHCRVVESNRGDLGGGAWQGQLLDDCDSAGGSSGGGLIAVLQGRQYLIGIRNGSHWSEQAFPVNAYPQGPPDGATWDRSKNTNFARAFDSILLSELKNFSLGLAAGDALSQ